jgi:DNA-binding beta-propeller fold protein YncE
MSMHRLDRNRQRVAGLLAAVALAGWPAMAAIPTATAQPVGNPWIAFIAGGTEVSVLDVPDGTTAVPVPGITLGTASAVAFSPNGTTAYFLDSTGVVTTLDTTNGNVDTIPVTGATSLTDIAITPDGAKAYVRDTAGVYSINLTAAPPTTALVGGTAGTAAISLSPNGATLYAVQGAGNLLTFNTSTDTSTLTITIPAAGPRLLAVAPDGRTLYTTTAGDVVPVDLTQPAPAGAGTPIDVPAGGVTSLAVAPDGTAYATVGTNLVALDNPTNLISLTLNGATGDGTSIAFTPDGGTILVTTDDGEVVPVTGGIAQAPVDAVTAAAGVRIAVTPDQAPAAALSVDAAQTPTAFDASASTVEFGTIASYTWDFGDGTALVTTTTPTTTHAYAGPGTYNVSVTLTSSGGTSTTQVFNGRSVVRNGGPQAVAVQAVTPTGYLMAVTGVDTGWGLVVGGLALAVGVGFVLLSRRRGADRR